MVNIRNPSDLDPYVANEVRLAVRGISTSSVFVPHPALSRLLKHIIDVGMEPPFDEPLSEVAIGKALYHPNYASGKHTTARANMTLLRQRLDLYYASVGKADYFKIDLPKPGYDAIVGYAHPEHPDRARLFDVFPEIDGFHPTALHFYATPDFQRAPYDEFSPLSAITNAPTLDGSRAYSPLRARFNLLLSPDILTFIPWLVEPLYVTLGEGADSVVIMPLAMWEASQQHISPSLLKVHGYFGACTQLKSGRLIPIPPRISRHVEGRPVSSPKLRSVLGGYCCWP